MALISLPAFVWDCGWGIGAFILLLQGFSWAVPAGEARDWAYFYASGIWAGTYIASGLLKREVTCARPIRQVLTFYAAACLSYYFILPLISAWFVWLWIFSVAVGWAWSKPYASSAICQRLLWCAVLSWCVLLAFSMCGSLIYNSPWYAIKAQVNTLPLLLSLVVILLLACPFMYMALLRPEKPASPRSISTGVRAFLHTGVIYLLTLLLFRTDMLDHRSAIHHWKAYLEPAAAVRDGGWLLWDVPNVYGWLQTLVMAFIPVDTTWQSLYLLNGTLLVASGYAIFYALSSAYPTYAGYLAGLVLAVCSTVLMLPTTGDPRMFPSTAALRFFWVYPMVAYVFWLGRCFILNSRLSRHALLAGHALWLTGALWSTESALFVTIIWLPSLVLLSLAEVLAVQAKPSVKQCAGHVAKRISGLVLLTLGALGIIAAVYQAGLGHMPDISLLTAYAKQFAFNYATLPIAEFLALSCWLFAFAIMVLLCRQYVAGMALNARNICNLAVLYAITVALWAVTSYYIPFSEDLHLTGTLPIMMYLSALLLLLLPQLRLPHAVKAAYEKGAICLYSVLVLGTLSHMDLRWMDSIRWLAPVASDVTSVLPQSPPELKALIEKAGVPAGAHVFVPAQPFAHRDGDDYLDFVEGAYFHDILWKNWLLPNTVLAYDKPLPPELYITLGERRMARMDNQYGWVFESIKGSSKQAPFWLDSLEHYAHVKKAIETYYRQVAVFENREYRIRKYERKPVH